MNLNIVIESNHIFDQNYTFLLQLYFNIFPTF
jgi:hypothetical protein